MNHLPSSLGRSSRRSHRSVDVGPVLLELSTDLIRCGDMTSVVIAAHNEGTVVGRCLDALLANAEPGELEVVVVANGCTDDTVDRAARSSVRVMDLPNPGKAAALNAGEEIVRTFPRIYLDADMTVDVSVVRALVAALAAGDGVLAAVPRRRIDLRGRPLTVRAYYAVSQRLPAFDEGLFGRGMIALSREGRARFAHFPEVIADDLYLDSLFAAEEKRLVDGVSTIVAAPTTTRDLLNRLVRVRRGNVAMRATTGSARVSDRWSWLRDVVVPRPWLAPAGVVYATITTWASRRAKRSQSSTAWERDSSTR